MPSPAIAQRVGDASLGGRELAQPVAHVDAPGVGERSGVARRDLVRELAQQPRVAGGLVVAAVALLRRGAGRVAPDQCGAPGRAERTGLEHGGVRDAAELGDDAGSRRHDDQQRDVAGAAGEVGERLQRGAVGPVGVVDQQRERALLRQRGAGPEQAVGDRRRRVAALERERTGAQRLLQQRPDDAERELPLGWAVGGAAHAEALVVRAPLGEVDQRGLAGAGGSLDDDRGAGAGGDRHHRSGERLDLGVSFDEHSRQRTDAGGSAQFVKPRRFGLSGASRR